MTNYNDMVDRIEAQLGSSGTRRLAEAMMRLMRERGVVTFDPHFGFQMAEMDPGMFSCIEVEAQANESFDDITPAQACPTDPRKWWFRRYEGHHAVCLCAPCASTRLEHQWEVRTRDHGGEFAVFCDKCGCGLEGAQ